MSALQIDLYSDYYYTFNIRLEDDLFTFTIRYNETDLAWYLNILGVTDTTIDIKGIRLVCSIDLLEQYNIIKLGSLYMMDNSRNKNDPDFDGLGSIYTMCYIPKGETL